MVGRRKTNTERPILHFHDVALSVYVSYTFIRKPTRQPLTRAKQPDGLLGASVPKWCKTYWRGKQNMMPVQTIFHVRTYGLMTTHLFRIIISGNLFYLCSFDVIESFQKPRVRSEGENISRETCSCRHFHLVTWLITNAHVHGMYRLFQPRPIVRPKSPARVVRQRIAGLRLGTDDNRPACRTKRTRLWAFNLASCARIP